MSVGGTGKVGFTPPQHPAHGDHPDAWTHFVRLSV